jgi:hypothetical protein
VKSSEEVMEILAAFDLTGSLRDAAELAGCSHHTVARYGAARGQGRVPGGPPGSVEIIVQRGGQQPQPEGVPHTPVMGSDLGVRVTGGRRCLPLLMAR